MKCDNLCTTGWNTINNFKILSYSISVNLTMRKTGENTSTAGSRRNILMSLFVSMSGFYILYTLLWYTEARFLTTFHVKKNICTISEFLYFVHNVCRYKCNKKWHDQKKLTTSLCFLSGFLFVQFIKKVWERALLHIYW